MRDIDAGASTVAISAAHAAGELSRPAPLQLSIVLGVLMSHRRALVSRSYGR
jgi:hypothetical protein